MVEKTSQERFEYLEYLKKEYEIVNNIKISPRTKLQIKVVMALIKNKLRLKLSVLSKLVSVHQVSTSRRQKIKF